MVSDTSVAKKYIQIHDSAKSRGIEFDMSLKKVRQLLTRKTCYFTGQPFDSKNVRSFDRLNNEIGYVDSNVVACGQIINSRKGSLSLIELRQIYKGTKHIKI